MKAIPSTPSPTGRRRSIPRPAMLLAVLLTGLLPTAPLAAQVVSGRLQNLAAFGDNGGSIPAGPLVQGSDGNFYGTARYGGTSDRGTVFRATAAGALTTVYNFTGGSDGSIPDGGVVIGRDGNFYGTTDGFSGLPRSQPSGTLYQLTPAGVLTTLHQFAGTASGGLVQGSDGNFYGVAPAVQVYDPGQVYPGTVGASSSAVTPAAEDDNDGIFFRVTPAGDFTVLYSFSNDNGQNPFGKLIQGDDGNFYGTTFSSSGGTVFQITPSGVLTTFFDFSSTNEHANPSSSLVQDRSGNLYGTTSSVSGGRDTVFRLDRGGGLTILHTFNGNDGKLLQTGLTLGSDGNLYGGAIEGGVNTNTNVSTTTGYGTLFQLTPAGVLTTLYNFSGEDGSSPNGPLLQAGNGLFYGTTAISTGASDNDGFLFALQISNQPAFFTGEVALTKGVYYLQFPNTDFFGLYSFLSDPHYLYHFDLGYEYVIDANDGQGGVYLYDFKSGDFWYTSPTFPFPYLYDFALKSFLYYYPASFAGRYTSSPRQFYNFSTGQNITR